MSMKKGFKHSEETKQKMSKSAIKKLKNPENHPMYGLKHSEETKQKMSEAKKNYIPWNKGLKNCYSKESLKKMSKAKSGKNHPMYGKKITFSDKHKNNMSKSHIGKNMGELNPNWKGGISCEPYCDVWLDREYKLSIKERDRWKSMSESRM